MKITIVLLLAAGLACGQTTRPSSRAADDRDRMVEAPFRGDDLPGRNVTGGRAWLPITKAPYSRPDGMRHPVSDEDLVIGVAGEGVARAYPVKMLGGPHREIVNDRLGQAPYAVNW